MDRRIDQLPSNTISSDCVVCAEENGTTSVKMPVNASNGLAGLDANARVPYINQASAPNVFNVKDFGALGDNSTDDTVAIQNAIDACVAYGGGIVFFPKGIYIVNGALQDTSSSNCQLRLPAKSAADQAITLTFLGSRIPLQTPSVGGSVVLPSEGSIIKGTLNTGSGGALLGGSQAGPTFTNLQLKIENLVFRMPSNPVLSALNLLWLDACEIYNVICDTGEYNTLAVTQPTTANSYGIQLPGNNNGAFTKVDCTSVLGFYNGYRIGEHTYIDMASAWACVNALTFEFAYHASFINRLEIVNCNNGLVFVSGPHYTTVKQFDTEHSPSGWPVTSNDIYDPSNHGYGDISWHAVLGGSGVTNTFTVNGGSNLAITQLGVPSTINQLFYREDSPYAGTALTGVSGNDTITLSKTPYASPDSTLKIYKNGTRLVTGTDITFSGLVGTLTTPCSGGEIFEVEYWSTISPAATTLTTHAILTGFDPANTATGLSLSNSNRTATRISNAGIGCARSINSHATGKWYAEIAITSGNSDSPFGLIGIADSTVPASSYPGIDTHGWGYSQQSGQKFFNNVVSSYGTGYVDGDIVGIAVDLSSGKVWFALNNVWQASGDPVAGTNEAFSGVTGTIFVMADPWRAGGPNAVMTAQFKSSDLTYSPPSGYSSWD